MSKVYACSAKEHRGKHPMSTAAIVAGTIGAVGSIGSAAIGANAAGNAADAQTSAANHAADLQQQESQAALDFQKQQYATSQAQQQPWLQAGQSGLNALQYGMGTGGTANGSGVAQGSLTTPYSGSFTAPTGLTEQNDPGYQARLQLGQDAIQRSAAASGGVVTGGTAQALNNQAQTFASNEYGNVYNRALTDYTTKYNAYNTDQTNQYNKLAALSGTGQQTATNMANQGQAASNNVTSNLLTTGQNVGQQYNNAGAATASGYVGAGNAYSSGLSGATSNLSNLAMLSSMSGYGQGMNTVPTAGMSMANG
jgi:hypothetical protein